jgi:serine/threonine protein phosphatase PrpC
MYLEILGRTVFGANYSSLHPDGKKEILFARKGHPPEFGDHFYFKFELEESPVLIAVADGDLGERVASRETLRFLAEQFEGFIENDDVSAQLTRMVEAVNRELFEKYTGKGNPGDVIGASLTAACFFRGTAYFLQIGKNCGYIFRNGELKRLVRIQTLLELLRLDGHPFEIIRSGYGANNPLQLMGWKEVVLPELTESTIEPDDIFLLCTKGLLLYDENGDVDTWMPGAFHPSPDLGEIEVRLLDFLEQREIYDIFGNDSTILVKVTAGPNS